MASLLHDHREFVERHQQLLTDLMPVFLLIPLLLIGLGLVHLQNNVLHRGSSWATSSNCDLEYAWCVIVNLVDDDAGPTRAREACAACETRGTPQPR